MFPPVLRPTTDLAPRALLPGDPGRALALAQLLTEKPLMFNHHRGLWGYTGIAADGLPLTVQATGVGGPSAAAVVADLAGLGLQVAIRVGSCRPIAHGAPPWGRLVPGSVLAVRSALIQDGTSRALSTADRVMGDRDLTDALIAAAGGLAEHVVCCDVLPGAPGEALVTDRTTAGLLVAAAEHGVRAAAILAIADDQGDVPVEELARVVAAALGLDG